MSCVQRRPSPPPVRTSPVRTTCRRIWPACFPKRRCAEDARRLQFNPGHCPPEPVAALSRRLRAFVKSVFDPPILSVSFDFYLAGLVTPRKNQGHRHRARPLCIGPQVFLMGVRPHYPTTLGLLHTERLSFGGHICSSNFGENSLLTAASNRAD